MKLEANQDVLARAGVEWWLRITVIPVACLVLGGVALVATWLSGVATFWEAVKFVPWIVVAAGVAGGYIGWVRATRRLHYLGRIESGLAASLIRAVTRKASERGGDIPALIREVLDEQIRRLPQAAWGRAARSCPCRRTGDRASAPARHETNASGSGLILSRG